MLENSGIFGENWIELVDLMEIELNIWLIIWLWAIAVALLTVKHLHLFGQRIQNFDKPLVSFHYTCTYISYFEFEIHVVP